MSLGSFRTVWRFARVIVAPVITLICRLSSLLEEEQSCQVLRLQDKSERGEKEKATSHVNNLNFCTHRHRKAALEQRYKKRCKNDGRGQHLLFLPPPFSTSQNRANHSQIYEMRIFCILRTFCANVAEAVWREGVKNKILTAGGSIPSALTLSKCKNLAYFLHWILILWYPKHILSHCEGPQKCIFLSP